MERGTHCALWRTPRAHGIGRSAGSYETSARDKVALAFRQRTRLVTLQILSPAKRLLSVSGCSRPRSLGGTRRCLVERVHIRGAGRTRATQSIVMTTLARACPLPT